MENKDALIRWLQSQVFGPRSERRLLEELTPEDQLWLDEEMLEPSENPPPPEVTVARYERKLRGEKKTGLSENCASSRLKFDDTVPVEEIRVADPELAKRDPEQVEFIGEEVTHRLAQRSSYVVLKYVRQVWSVLSANAPSSRAPLEVGSPYKDQGSTRHAAETRQGTTDPSTFEAEREARRVA